MHLVNTTSVVILDIFENISTSKSWENLLSGQELLIFISALTDMVDLIVSEWLVNVDCSTEST